MSCALPLIIKVTANKVLVRTKTTLRFICAAQLGRYKCPLLSLFLKKEKYSKFPLKVICYLVKS